MLSFRIRFNKTEKIKYTAHLDVNRLFMRAINRADIDIQYSEGFNPHPRLVFACPLSLGIVSYAEYLDIKTSDSESADGIRERLSAVLPAGIEITEVYAAKNDFKYLDSSVFELYFLPFYEIINMTPGDTVCGLNKLLSSDTIETEKKSKTKTENVNIKKYIINASAEAIPNDYIKITATLKTNSTDYLNPEYLFRAAQEKLSTDGRDIFQDKSIIKRASFGADGAEFI